MWSVKKGHSVSSVENRLKQDKGETGRHVVKEAIPLVKA